MRGIHKSFGPVRALWDVNLVLYPGEILGLVGDNSAGKSTLMKILTGAYQRDARARSCVDGEPVHFKSPHESRDRGIEMIYQDFALCGNMDVGQNIFLGRWPTGAGLFVDRRKMYAEARRGADAAQGRRQLRLPAGREPVRRPPAIGRHRPRHLLRSARSSSSTSRPPTSRCMATERLLETMLELKKPGRRPGHHLAPPADIFAVGDRVMVLKRGDNVGDRAVATPPRTKSSSSSSRACRVPVVAKN